MDENKKSTETKVEKVDKTEVVEAKLKEIEAMLDEEDKGKKRKQKPSYRQQRKRIIRMLAKTTPGTQEYKYLTLALKDLESSHDIKRSKAVTGDCIAKCTTTAVTTTAMMIFESENPIRSKLLSFIPKLIK